MGADGAPLQPVSSVKPLRRRRPFRQLIALALRCAFWIGVIWFIYPNALSLALWDSNARYLGLAFFALVIFAVYRCVVLFVRVAAWFGVKGGIAALVMLFAGLTVAHGVSNDAASARDWLDTIRGSAATVQDRGNAAWRRMLDVPTEAYMSVTTHRPPWRPEPDNVLDVPPLAVSASSAQGDLGAVVDGVTVGIMVQVITGPSGLIELTDSPDPLSGSPAVMFDGAAVFVLDGPVAVGGRTSWLVSDGAATGWCDHEYLQPY